MKHFNIVRYIFSTLLLFSISVSAQNAIIDTTFNDTLLVDKSLTRSIDYMSNPGHLQLESGENEDLALRRSAYIVYTGAAPTDTALRNPLKLLDGIQGTFIVIPTRRSNEDSYIMIDLQATRTIKRVVIRSFINPNVRVRAFTIYAGEDSIAMDKVYENLDNQDLVAIADFTPIVSRYVRIVVNVIHPAFDTGISDIQVFGEGFLPEGTFTSSVRSVGRRVNFGTFEFIADIPDGTDAEFRFRTGDTGVVDSTWSNWSQFIKTSNSLFTVFEPRTNIQYQLNLKTANLFTPIIDEIKINYDTINVATSSTALINPQISQILVESEFTMNIDVVVNPNDYGIDTLSIITPSPSELLDVRVNGQPAAYLLRVTAARMVIVFNATITSNAQISIRFKTTPFLAVNNYETSLSSNKVTYNPQWVDAPLKNGNPSWSIITVGVPDKLIIDPNVEPNPFTPNGDGINDETFIKFFLGNVDIARRLTVNIYDLTGRRIRDLFDTHTVAAAFVSDNSIKWDGRDNSGKMVRPGIYIYQIKIDSDNGGQNVTKTVVVAY